MDDLVKKPMTPDGIMDHIKYLAKQYIRLLEETERIKAEYKAFAEIGYRKLTPEDAYNTAYEVFWDNPEMPPGMTGWIVGKSPSQVTAYLVKREYSTCSNCGGPMILKTKKTHNHVETMCDICASERRKAEYAAYYARHAEQHAQRQAEEEQRRQMYEQYIQDLKTMPYQDYLQTDHWKEVRASALKRARYRCQLCNTNGQLNVHHRTYENRGHEAKGDLIVLCRSCHAKHHGKDE